MTQQAKNSITLYSGGNPSKIKALLTMQNSNVVDELKEHFNASTLDKLAVKLSVNR